MQISLSLVYFSHPLQTHQDHIRFSQEAKVIPGIFVALSKFVRDSRTDRAIEISKTVADDEDVLDKDGLVDAALDAESNAFKR